MRAVELIAKKRDGGVLTSAEITFLIEGYTRGEIADYQMAAWAMAVLLRGMDKRETADLTLAMAHSGDMLDLHDVVPLTVDKHSTGGVGDKTTLVLAPLVAAVGLPVAKMSGRGLGFSGGTIDKLESIPGFRANLDPQAFRRQVRDIGLVVAAQTGNLAPADKKLYALRDVTATVPSLPLIAASVMSKKLAAGADCIVLDVKYGSGAFMHTVHDARRLAEIMVGIARHAGRRASALLTSMEQPLGLAVGNALEVREAIATLRGAGPADLVELAIALGVELLLMAERASDEAVARLVLEAALASGAAWEKFCAMVVAQGGDRAFLENPARLPTAPVIAPLRATQRGYIAAINTEALGWAVNTLGGGREHKGDAIDAAVGLLLHVRVGDYIDVGQPLLAIHAANEEQSAAIAPRLLAAYTLSAEPVAIQPLIAETVRE